MPKPIRLSEDEMRRIEAEELAALRAVQEEEAQVQRRLAAHAYRQEVRLALQPRPFWWPVRWVLPFIPVVAVVVFVLLRPAVVVPDSAWGGIEDSELLGWCKREVTADVGASLGAGAGAGGLVFPSVREAAGQLSASADGKRWDGWVSGAGGARSDFSCTYTAAEKTLQIEVIQEDLP